MAGTKSSYIQEMFTKFKFFRTNSTTPITIQSRPTEDNNTMIQYITRRWTGNEDISQGLQVDNIFMAVCTFLCITENVNSILTVNSGIFGGTI